MQTTMPRTQLILGGQKSGKSRFAETIAANWLGQSAEHEVLFIATAQAYDSEMRQRIERHQLDRKRNLPQIKTLEEPLLLAAALQKNSAPHRLLLIDCLTLWLSNYLTPHVIDADIDSQKLMTRYNAAHHDLLRETHSSVGPLVLVSNEISQGVIPMGQETRQFVDQLGLLNQAVAKVCERVTLMVAGCPIAIKGDL
jgi:adenosylcobinamide kinase/adenosylcobinamide-phosphate guanylyltransferase